MNNRHQVISAATVAMLALATLPACGQVKLSESDRKAEEQQARSLVLLSPLVIDMAPRGFNLTVDSSGEQIPTSYRFHLQAVSTAEPSLYAFVAIARTGEKTQLSLKCVVPLPSPGTAGSHDCSDPAAVTPSLTL